VDLGSLFAKYLVTLEVMECNTLLKPEGHLYFHCEINIKYIIKLNKSY